MQSSDEVKRAILRLFVNHVWVVLVIQLMHLEYLGIGEVVSDQETILLTLEPPGLYREDTEAAFTIDFKVLTVDHVHVVAQLFGLLAQNVNSIVLPGGDLLGNSGQSIRRNVCAKEAQHWLVFSLGIRVEYWNTGFILHQCIRVVNV